MQHPNGTDSPKMWSTNSHGLLTLPLASFGVILNLMTITIFLQKSMRSLTNNILLGISIFDMLMMIIYVPYTVYFYLLRTPDPFPDQSMFWPYFLVFHNHFSLFTHACSVSIFIRLQNKNIIIKTKSRIRYHTFCFRKMYRILIKTIKNKYFYFESLRL